MKDRETPLMKQYRKVKEKYPEMILLFRMGDFFETFEDEAAAIGSFPDAAAAG